ncbi:energy transducer TonB [Algibacter pectinivorans]|uniref:Protein TonB n=1 Tax=Algibacter pectinivorans TaxID=870482 RepID=A0A1I1MQV4_9FLAO|nr:energy transducer TonB [Algibacter pectinivorans]SFC87771.1 protein TonB [Algibacter pectinivorans]
MSNQKKTHDLIRQNEKIVEKSQKHDANLQKNSTLYFQIGLIVCLLISFGLLEMKFETTAPPVVKLMPPDIPEEISINNIKVEELLKPEVKPQPKKKVAFINKIKEIDDDVTLEEVLELVTEEQKPVTPVVDPGAVVVDENPGDEEPVSIVFVQKVPIYPGCETSKNNTERKKCMSDKIGKLIQRKFDGGDIAAQYGLEGKQKIDVQFTIDKTGKVTNVKTRADHDKLKEEAARVINFIPEMIPGKQNNKNIGVIYALPIVFYVQ